jgi:hypothetical protein
MATSRRPGDRPWLSRSPSRPSRLAGPPERSVPWLYSGRFECRQRAFLLLQLRLQYLLDDRGGLLHSCHAQVTAGAAGSATGDGVGAGSGAGSGSGGGVGFRLGGGVGFRLGAGVGFRLGAGVGFRLGAGVGFGLGAGVGFRLGGGDGAGRGAERRSSSSSARKSSPLRVLPHITQV